VSKYMVRGRSPSQGWKTFFRNHAQAIAAIDLFVVPTLTFERLFRGFGAAPRPAATAVVRGDTTIYAASAAPLARPTALSASVTDLPIRDVCSHIGSCGLSGRAAEIGNARPFAAVGSGDLA
jgi:hypothetical protein